MRSVVSAFLRGLAAALVISLPALAQAPKPPAGVPMAALDPEFDAKNLPQVKKLREQIAAAEKTKGKGKTQKPSKADRERVEVLRDALVDVGVGYVAQIEIADALLRTELKDALAARYKADFHDTVWRLDQRAIKGDENAQATLGALYRLGVVAEQNSAKACDYYAKAAEKGHVAALYQASACAGTGAERSQLLERAAAGGQPLAQEMVGRACAREKRDRDCTITWLNRAAAQGRSSAMSLLGFMYSQGDLVGRDEKRAFAYFLDAAKLGDMAAQNNIGQMYETGRGTAANPAEAFAWYKRAAERGLGYAQVNVARCYIEARGTPQDYASAKQWLEKAQQQGVGEATKLLDFLAKQGKAG
jgi:TPR repeat protein